MAVARLGGAQNVSSKPGVGISKEKRHPLHGNSAAVIRFHERETRVRLTVCLESERVMGIIRKTLSIGTLGTINFRSKKEKLRRAERSLRDAEGTLLQEVSARETAELRVRDAERRMDKANAEALRATEKLSKRQEKKRFKKSQKLTGAEKIMGAIAMAEPLVAKGMEVARNAVASDTAKHVQARGRKARKQAKKAAKELQEEATKTAVRLRKEGTSLASDLRDDAEKRMHKAKRKAKREAKTAKRSALEVADSAIKRARKSAEEISANALTSAQVQLDAAGEKASDVYIELKDHVKASVLN